MTSVLFVTWDAPESSYLEGLFLPIFDVLRRQRSVKTCVLQVTWGSKRGKSRMQEACDRQSIGYSEVRVFRWSVAVGAIIGIFQAARAIDGILKKGSVDVVIARSTLPAMATLLARRRHPHVRFIFDADGLPHDERVEFEGWSADGLQYRVLRDIEALAVRRADRILVRSAAAVDVLHARGGPTACRDKFFKVTNARDDVQFTPATLETRRSVRRELQIAEEAPLICFVGSAMVGKYCGVEMFRFFRMVQQRRPDARLAIFTERPEEAKALLVGFPELSNFCSIRFVEPRKISSYVGACDLGLAFIKPGFSMRAASAIKVGEYLLCGVPVLATAGIGDADDVLEQGVGYSLHDMEDQELSCAADWFLSDVMSRRQEFSERCRLVGIANYALSNSAAEYSAALGLINGCDG